MRHTIFIAMLALSITARADILIESSNGSYSESIHQGSTFGPLLLSGPNGTESYFFGRPMTAIGLSELNNIGQTVGLASEPSRDDLLIWFAIYGSGGSTGPLSAEYKAVPQGAGFGLLEDPLCGNLTQYICIPFDEAWPVKLTLDDSGLVTVDLFKLGYPENIFTWQLPVEQQTQGPISASFVHNPEPNSIVLMLPAAVLTWALMSVRRRR